MEGNLYKRGYRAIIFHMLKKALIVGNDLYEGYPLHGCENDAQSMRDVLARNYDDSPNFSTDLRLNESQQGLKRAIKSLFTGKCEVALFYFAGHGSAPEDENGIVGTDGHIVPFNYIMECVSKSNHRHNILIFDSCFSGGAGYSFCNKENTASLPSGVTILSACRSNETASEQSGHGLFTYFLMEALNGGAANLLGDITPGAVYAFIDRCLGPWDQRPIFMTHEDSFCSIRKTEAPVPLSVLRNLPKLFPNSSHILRLNPSYEPTNSPDAEHKIIEPYACDCNVKVFHDLQLLERGGLVIPLNAEHMYYAAMNSQGCKLTPVGTHYWELANEGKI